MTTDHRGWLYAQRSSGHKMHLVEKYGDDSVAGRALCGVVPDSRGDWRMTANVSFAHACKNCRRAKP